MKIAVLSDLHAFCSDAQQEVNGKKPPAPSLIDFSSLSRKPKTDPLVGFVELFQSESELRPDVIILAGDLGDKADTQAIRSVWDELGKLSTDIGVRMLLATCGNHDLDTRHKQNKFDPRGFLRTLDPGFPYPNQPFHRENQLEYWAENFTIVEEDDFRILNINSCAFHGFGEKAEPELEHGRISDITLDEIEKRLSECVSEAPHKQNICLFHHHIKPISTDDFEDSSIMKGAERLLQMLSRVEFGEWFIIHGHRHRSSLFCAGGNSAPIVLSCASFAATRSGDEHNPTPNQFYLVELDKFESGEFARVTGNIQSWSWTSGIGWQSKTSIPGGLPVKTGFGYRGYIPNLAQEIEKKLTTVSRLSWSELLEHFPDVGRLMPSDTETLIKSLERLPVVVSEMDGQIQELVKSNV